LAALLFAGCPAAHDDYPSTRCKVDNDCYQGETCSKSAGANTGVCQAGGATDGSAP
jgi:hypothetical protein